MSKSPIQNAVAEATAAAPAAGVESAQAFGKSEPATPAKAAKGANMPTPEWTQTTKETVWSNRSSDAFGAESAGEDVGAPTTSMLDGKATKIEEAAEGDAAEGEVTTEAKPATETADAIEKLAEAKEEPAAPVEEKPSALRRKALDALRLEGDRRALTQRLQDEQRQRELEKQTYLQSTTRLKTATLEERLRLIGVETQEELLEAAISGKVRMPDVAPAKPVEADPKIAALEAKLAELASKEEARERVVNDARASAAIANTRALLSGPEVSFPFTLAEKDGVESVMQAAVDLWVAGGSVAGTESKHVLKAAELAEEALAERYAPAVAAYLKKTGGAPKPAPAAPVIPGKKPLVAGKKMAPRGTDVDDGPAEVGASAWGARDRWVKEQMNKEGKGQW